MLSSLCPGLAGIRYIDSGSARAVYKLLLLFYVNEINTDVDPNGFKIVGTRTCQAFSAYNKMTDNKTYRKKNAFKDV